MCRSATQNLNICYAITCHWWDYGDNRLPFMRKQKYSLDDHHTSTTTVLCTRLQLWRLPVQRNTFNFFLRKNLQKFSKSSQKNINQNKNIIPSNWIGRQYDRILQQMLWKITENFIYRFNSSFIREKEEGSYSSLNPLNVFPFPPTLLYPFITNNITFRFTKTNNLSPDIILMTLTGSIKIFSFYSLDNI